MMTGSVGEVRRVTSPLHCHDNLAGDVQRIYAQMRRGNMRGLTVHANAEMIDCGVVDARFESYRACLQIIRGVQTEHALGTIQHTGCDKRLCTFSDFLSG